MSVPGQPERLEQFSEETRTVIVFPQGAVIRLSATVGPGQMLVVANRRSHQEVLCRVVNVKNHPNVKGYVEIEFTQPTNGFWGVYFPQEALKSSAGTGAGGATKAQPIAPTLTPTPASIPASTPASIPAASASRPKPPAAAPSSPDDFWGSSFPAEVIAPAAEPAPQSSVPAASASAAPASSGWGEPQSFPAPAIHTPAIEMPGASDSLAASDEEKISEVVPPPPHNIGSSTRLAQPPRPELEPIVISADPWGKDAAVELPPVVIPSSSPRGVESFANSDGLASIADEIHAPKAKEPIDLSPRADTSITTLASPSISSASLQAASARKEWGTLGGIEQRVESSVEESPLSSVPDLFGSPQEQADTPFAADSAQYSSRTMVMIGAAVVVLLIAGAAGFFFLRGSPAKSAAIPANPPEVTSPATPSASPASMEKSVPSATSNPVPVVPPPPVAAAVKSASQPTRQAQNSHAGADVPEPASPQPPERKPAWAGQIPNGKLLARAGPSAKANYQDAPPDLSGAAANTPADAITAALPAGTNDLPAPPPVPERTEPVHVGGRLKEPRLASKVLPVYPPSAKQIGLEGKVVIDTVIDPTGNVTNTKVVSGPALLQRAALDAVRKWKYEPSYLDDKPVAVQMFITVEFRLR